MSEMNCWTQRAWFFTEGKRAEREKGTASYVRKKK